MTDVSGESKIKLDPQLLGNIQLLKAQKENDAPPNGLGALQISLSFCIWEFWNTGQTAQKRLPEWAFHN